MEIAEAGGAGCSGSGWPGLTHWPCERLMAWWPEEGREGQRGGQQEGLGQGGGGQHRRLTLWAAVEAPGAPLGRGGTLGQDPWEEGEGENVGKSHREERTERQGPQKHREEAARPCGGRGPALGQGYSLSSGGQQVPPAIAPAGGSCGAEPSRHRPAQGSRVPLGDHVCRPLASNLGIPGHSWGPPQDPWATL